jgi:hypothetical protein
MRKYFLLILAILCFSSVVEAKPLIMSTRVQQALANGLALDGTWDTITFSDGTSQSSAGLTSPLADELDAGGQVISDAEFKDYSETVVTTLNADGATNLDYSAGNYHVVTLAEDVTFTITNGPADGKGASMVVDVVQDNLGTATITWINVKWAGGTTPTTATGVGTESFYTLFGTASDSWNGAEGISDSR